MKRSREYPPLFFFDYLNEYLPHPGETPDYEPFSDRVVYTAMAIFLVLAVLYQVL